MSLGKKKKYDKEEEPKITFRPGDVVSFHIDKEKALTLIDANLSEWGSDYVITRIVKGLDVFNFPQKSYVLIPVRKIKNSQLYKITNGKKIVVLEKVLRDHSEVRGNLSDLNQDISSKETLSVY